MDGHYIWISDNLDLTEDQLEVDFLARHRGAGDELVQVCADPSGPETLAREVRASSAAAAAHPRAERKLLGLDRDALVPLRTPGVDVLPAYEWLLTERGRT